MPKNNETLDKVRHSASHILAYAVAELFGNGVKFAIGPTIEDGFYYDFDLNDQTFTPEDLKKLEAKMSEIIKKKMSFERTELTITEALEKMADQPYKLELIKDLAEAGETKVSFYTVGDFTDLCRGPHIENTKDIGAFKLMKIAGAYWKGSEKNKMLQRIYGTAFETKEQLADYLNLLEEAEKRDHRKLGKELDLFMMHDYAPGIPFFLPKGMQLLIELTKFTREYSYGEGYREVRTPQLFNSELWKESGHWEHYQEDMFHMHHSEDDSEIGIKPMNCPGHMLVFRRDAYSYRELPLRIAETTTLYRNEKSGTLSGLTRVRSISQDDTHIFLAESQIFDEIIALLDKIKTIYKIFNLEIDEINLSTRPEKFLGEKETWDRAEDGLKKALAQAKLDYTVDKGGGAFYGPKIDVKVKDALNRQWQLATIQLDYQLPARFGLEYTDSDGDKKMPVVIHRALLGSMERFLGIIIEHYAGAFPTWLSPVQTVIIPVSEKFNAYGNQVLADMKIAGVRAELDDSSESLGKRIRNAEKQKTPYILVIGEKEVEAGTVAVRKRGEGDLGAKKLEEFITDIKRESAEKK